MIYRDSGDLYDSTNTNFDLIYLKIIKKKHFVHVGGLVFSGVFVNIVQALDFDSNRQPTLMSNIMNTRHRNEKFCHSHMVVIKIKAYFV